MKTNNLKNNETLKTDFDFIIIIPTQLGSSMIIWR